MAFDLNFTNSVFGTDDAEFQLTKFEGAASTRKAVFPDGKEITRVISHDVKKRERHVVKDTLVIPATATSPARTTSVHTVIDQALAPDSADIETAQLVAAHNTFVTDNRTRIQAGEI